MSKATKIRGLMLAGALMLAVTTAAAQEHRCYTAEIPGAVVLPDGFEHGPSALRICTDRAISPVSNLHRTFVDGQPVGMFLSVPRVIEKSVEAGTAQFIFERGAGNRLILIAYAVSTRDRTTVYELPRTTDAIAEIAPVERHEKVVVIASAR